MRCLLGAAIAAGGERREGGGGAAVPEATSPPPRLCGPAFVHPRPRSLGRPGRGSPGTARRGVPVCCGGRGPGRGLPRRPGLLRAGLALVPGAGLGGR